MGQSKRVWEDMQEEHRFNSMYCSLPKIKKGIIPAQIVGEDDPLDTFFGILKDMPEEETDEEKINRLEQENKLLKKRVEELENSLSDLLYLR